MNKRIQELAEQAENDYRASVLGASMYKTPPDILMKKFAELIVRECSKVNNQYVGWRIGDIDLDMVYKEHFGVEE